MNDEKLEKVMTLINKANKDFAASKNLIETDCEYYWDIICFHCQQCVEKSLKAFLMYNETDFPKTHDLIFLLNLCLKSDSDFKNFDLLEFANYGVEIRYDDIPATLDETKNAFETAKTVMDYVKSYIDPESDLKRKSMSDEND